MRCLDACTLAGLTLSAMLLATAPAALACAPTPQDAEADAEVAQPAPRELPAPQQAPPHAKRDGAEAGSLEQDGNTAPGAEGFDEGQLDELVAPIALYPDVLLNQVLIACETPGDLAAADKLASRRGEGPIKPAKRWSAGIIALMHVPPVLHWLEESRIWSSQLGAAYKDHPRDVIAAIQRVRVKAQALGNLSSDDHRDVEDGFGRVTISLVDPAVLHVPIYDPTQVLEQHTSDCAEWFSYGPAFSIPGFKSVEAGFRSIEFTHAKPGESADFYRPAPPLVPTVTTRSGGGGGGGRAFRWLRGGDRHDDHDDHDGHHHDHD